MRGLIELAILFVVFRLFGLIGLAVFLLAWAA